MKEPGRQISILGCGWLGLPLAEALIKQGFSVKGSTTTPSKTSFLKEKGIQPFLIDLDEQEAKGSVIEFLKGSGTLIINIPPGFRKDTNRNFCATLESLKPYLADTAVKHILYISSTSVFPNLDRQFHEQDQFIPDTPSGKQLQEAETLIMDLNPGSNTVLRLGGLIGPDRHPVHYLSGKTDLPGGTDRINLIHLHDVIGIITAIIKTSQWGKILHGVAPYHPPKREYYPAIAARLDIPAPGYTQNTGESTGKIIMSRETTALLNYQFTSPKLDL